MIREVVEDNREDVSELLKKIGKKPQDFSYFRNKGQNKPLLTAVLYENNKGSACGHLELRGELAWLEIISTKTKENEFNHELIKYFLEESDKMEVNEIRLSILKSQEVIIDMYEKFNFKKYSEKGKKILLRRLKDEHYSGWLQL